MLCSFLQGWPALDQNATGLTLMCSSQINQNYIAANWKVTYLIPGYASGLHELRPRIDSEVYVYERDRNGHVLVSEVYSIAGTVHRKFVNKWQEGSFTKPMVMKWDRRRDFSNLTLNVAVNKLYPFVLYQDSRDATDEEVIIGGIRGIVIDILRCFHDIYGTRLEFRKSGDGQWGSERENGSWTGLVGMLVKHDVDLVAAPLTVTLSRSEGFQKNISNYERLI